MLSTNFARRRRTLHPCSPSLSHSFGLFHTLSLSGFLLSDFWSAIKVLKSMFKCWTKRHNNSMAKTKVAPPIHPPPCELSPRTSLERDPRKGHILQVLLACLPFQLAIISVAKFTTPTVRGYFLPTIGTFDSILCICGVCRL